MASAQKELSLIQKGLLAKKLAGPDLPLPSAVGPYDLARTIDLPLPKAEEPCVSARLRPGRPDQSEFLRKADEAGSGLPEVGLYSDIGMGQPIQGPSCLE